MTDQPGDSALPQGALERLKGTTTGDHRGIFTSDLSVNEFLLVREAGFEPVALVMGSCIYHVGIQYGKWSQNQEMDVLSQAMYSAREAAMTRMRQEAADVKADGIVGVRLEVKLLPWDNNLLEFLAIGTAIVHSSGSEAFRGPNGQPFTSDLSGQDFWTLLQSGHRPLEMVMGSCVYHIAHQGTMRSLGNIGKNTEITVFSQALYSARELAMERMQQEAMSVGAEGVTGVVVHEKNYNWDSHVIEFFAIGTAVVPIHDESIAPELAKPQVVLSVN